MLVTAFTRRALEQRRMAKAGWREIEPDWELIRGGRTDDRIAECKVAVDGKHIWIRYAPRKSPEAPALAATD